VTARCEPVTYLEARTPEIVTSSGMPCEPVTYLEARTPEIVTGSVAAPGEPGGA